MNENVIKLVPITKASLKEIGFRRFSYDCMSISCATDWNIIVVNFRNGHTEIVNANDSIVVHNCKAISDVKDLVRLFLKGGSSE